MKELQTQHSQCSKFIQISQDALSVHTIREIDLGKKLQKNVDIGIYIV